MKFSLILLWFIFSILNAQAGAKENIEKMDTLIALQTAGDKKALEAALKGLKKEEKRDLIFSYLEQFSEGQNIVPNKKTEIRFQKFLKISDKILKNKLCKYFYDCEYNIVTTKGLEKILKQSKMNSRTQVLELSQLTKAINKLDKNSETVLFVWHGSSKIKKKTVHAVKKHITPVFIKKDKDRTTVVITDSVGQAVHSYTNDIVDSINASKVSAKNLEIYAAMFPRQKDSLSCPIFSLLDADAHQRSNVFTQINEARQRGSAGDGESATSDSSYKFVVRESCPDSVEGVNIPIDMMKSLQSFSDINRFLDANPNLEYTPVASKDRGDLTIRELHDTNRYTEVEGQVEKEKTGFVRKQAYRYYGDLVKLIVNEELKLR